MVGCAPGVRSFWVTYVTQANLHGTNKRSKVSHGHGLSDNLLQHGGWEGSRDKLIGNGGLQSNVYIRMELR